MKKEDNLREQFKQALISTIKVISEEYKLYTNIKKNLSSNNYNFFELDNLNTRQDYTNLRAGTDSEALRRKFSDKFIYNKNLPKNNTCRSLYDVSEKIRYEILGSKMLKGISKNLKEHYTNKISLKRKDQLKSKEDVNVSEAFELYMLKNFFEIDLNPLSKKILSFWEKDFKNSFDKHLNYLNKNLENQDLYNSKFSEILQKMEIFEDENQDQEKNNEENQNDNSAQNEESENKENSEQETKQQDQDQNGVDADYELSDYKMDEQLVDTDSEKESSENIVQKMNMNSIDKEYKIFTTEFDEIAKAENLETSEEIVKLRKSLDQQLISFQDLISKLANKLQRQLLAKQNRAWEFDLEEGLLDSSKLTRIIIDPHNSLSFKKEKD